MNLFLDVVEELYHVDTFAEESFQLSHRLTLCHLDEFSNLGAQQVDKSNSLIQNRVAWDQFLITAGKSDQVSLMHVDHLVQIFEFGPHRLHLVQVELLPLEALHRVVLCYFHVPERS